MTRNGTVNPHAFNRFANLSATVTARFWSMICNFVAVPFFLKLLGIEGYAFVALFTLFSSLGFLVQFGLPQGLFWFLSKPPETSNDAEQLETVLATAQFLNAAAVTVLIAVTLVLPHRVFALIADGSSVPSQTFAQIMIWIFIAVLVQRFSVLFQQTLLGLQRQITVSIVTIVSTTLRLGGGLLLLAYVATDLILLFQWMSLVFAVEAVCLWFLLRHKIWSTVKPFAATRISWRKSDPFLRFSGAIWFSGVLQLLIISFDRLIVSVTLSLADYGTYALVFTLVMAGSVLTEPLRIAYSPYLRNSVTSTSDNAQHRTTTIAMARTISCIAFPPVVAIILFAEPLIKIWIGGLVDVGALVLLAQVMGVGPLVQVWCLVPVLYVIAIGRPNLSLVANAVIMVIIIPLTYFLVSTYQMIGAALTLPIYSVMYSLCFGSFVIKYFGLGSLVGWYARGPLLPFGVSALILGTAAFLKAAVDPQSDWVAILFMLAGLSIAWALCALFFMRAQVLATLRRIKTKL